MSTYSPSENIQSSPDIISLPIDQIEPNPFQPRTQFDDKKLSELAESISVQGITSPLLVRPHPEVRDWYQLAYGERRLRSAKMVGLKQVPCFVRPLTDNEMMEIGLTENLQREGLTPLEEANMFERLRQQFPAYASIRKLADRLGKDKGYIEDRLALLRLPDDLLTLVKDKPDVSLRAVREVAKVPEAELRAPLIQHLRDDEISTQQIIQRVKSILAPSAIPLNNSHPVMDRALKKMASRFEASQRESEAVLRVYRTLDPASRNKDDLLEMLQPLRDIIQRFEELP